MNSPETHNPEQQLSPRYDLSIEELAERTDILAKKALEEFDSSDGVFTVWMNPKSGFADIIRTYEAQIFPEIPEIMQPYEQRTRMLGILDTREPLNRFIHGFRISGLMDLQSSDSAAKESVAPNAQGEKSSIALLDDIVASDQNLSNEDIELYYSSIGVDLGKCISVETNFRIGEKSRDLNGIPIPQIGYIAVFNLMEALGDDIYRARIFAHLNRVAIISLKSVGIEYEPIAGRDDLKTPTVGEVEFDDHYTPVAITPSEKNLSIFSMLSSLAAPNISV